MNRLLEIGFQCVGHWRLDGDVIVCQLTSLMNTRNVLYAFVSNGDIKYIGKTTQSLKARMFNYQKPGPTQSTNIKNNGNIRTLLRAGEAVDIFVLPDNGLLRYGGFHINLAAGLEDSLISQISPPWNGRTTEEARRASLNQGKALKTIQKEQPDSYYNDNDAIETTSQTVFEFQLHETYLKQGFFNVPMKYTTLFGADRDRIEIYCGKTRNPIYGYINRTVNTNKTPRIMGGAQLRDWLQQHFDLDSRIQVDVLSPTSIRLANGS